MLYGVSHKIPAPVAVCGHWQRGDVIKLIKFINKINLTSKYCNYLSAIFPNYEPGHFFKVILNWPNSELKKDLIS